MSVQASCPACGGPITFKIGSAVVAICPFCRSAVARGDRSVEDLGKVAALVDTESPLQLGLKGKYSGVPFELVGRAQLKHPAGGLWDEWYAAFANGRWGWLAEAQGRFFMTFPQTAAPPAPLPSFDELQLGQSVQVVGHRPPLVVAEKGHATAVAADGEMPYMLVPNEVSNYADLSGPTGDFGTIEYIPEGQIVYLGREVTLDELAIPKSARRSERDVRQIESHQLACPQCGGPLELRAPDKSERVTCPSCSSLLDVNQGQLKFFKALEPGEAKPLIPLGTVGKLDEGEFTVIGYLVRRVKVEGVKYFWEEYLLYEPRLGFRWLVCSDDHWSFVRSVAPGEVAVRAQAARYRGSKFKLFQKDVAKVEYVLGEFYWKVSEGERAEMADFIRPPLMLSREIAMVRGMPERHWEEGDWEAITTDPEVLDVIPADAAGSGEINWSLGTWMPPKAIQQAFNLPRVPRGSGVAPHQPFGYKPVYLSWLLLMAIGIALGAIFLSAGSHKKVYEQTFLLPPLAPNEKSQVLFSDPFPLRARQNLEVEAWADADNSWVEVDGDLIDEATGLVQGFSIPIEYYYGVDGGESWSEGGRHNDTMISAVPAGNYTLRLEVERQKTAQPATVTVRITQGVPRVLNFFLLLLALSAIPGCVGIYHIWFEHRRWKDSAYSPYRSTSSE